MRGYCYEICYSPENNTPSFSTDEWRTNVGYSNWGDKTISEEEIQEVLKQMGKNKPSDEINCSSCGYPTCRDKAIAIIHGKSEISMCLPFLKEKAESFSDSIINNTPNGILVVNDKLEVQQINIAARKILNVRSASDD